MAAIRIRFERRSEDKSGRWLAVFRRSERTAAMAKTWPCRSQDRIWHHRLPLFRMNIVWAFYTPEKAENPPSTAMVVPVTNEEAVLAK